MKKAFTLIEVLIVVLILGILAIIAIPMMEGVKIRAQITQAILDVHQMERGIDFLIAEGNNPTEYFNDLSPEEFSAQYSIDIPEDNPWFSYSLYFFAGGDYYIVAIREKDGISLFHRNININGTKSWSVYNTDYKKYISLK